MNATSAPALTAGIVGKMRVVARRMVCRRSMIIFRNVMGY
jgi:hypothetical protein